jgi:outer membrane protein assembly factor BamB
MQHARMRASAGSMLAALLFVPATAVAASDQPQWGERYTRNMVSGESGLAETFDPATGKNVKWSARLGTYAYATPVVAGGKVLIGTNNARPRDPRHRGDRGVVMCFDEADGSFLWQLVVPKVEEDRYLDWPYVGITSPPTVDGDRAYLVSNRGEVLCLDMNGQVDGNNGPYRNEGRHMSPRGSPAMEVGKSDADIIWLYDMRAGVGSWQHDSANCSILVHGPYLYVCTSNGVDNTHKRVARPDAPSLIVLEKTTGRLVATDDAGIGPRIVHCMWSSPSLGEVNGRTLVFLGGGDSFCYAFGALDGIPAGAGPTKLRTVWRFDCDPEGPKGQLLKYQENRSEGPSNISGMPVFHKGRVYVTAGGDAWHGKRTCWIKCIDAGGTGDVTKTGEVWSRRLERHSLSTPAIKDGLLYITDCGHGVHCLDADTGRSCWTHETRGEIWGSTLVADGKVYIGTQGRDFWVLAEGREKRVIGSVRLDSAMSATPVAANGVLYVVTMRKLYAVRKGAE